MNVDISSINISGNQGVFDGKISLSVQNNDQLKKLIIKIKKVDGVKKVTRVNTL